MKTMYSPIVVVGGSLGGTIAAWAAAKCSCGQKVLLLEETDWIGGQLTSQAVPPDEHRWIGEQGCTASYREYRRRVRAHYRNLPGYSPIIKGREAFCPGNSEVSHISHPPRLALKLLTEMVQPYVDSGVLTIITGAKLVACDATEDKINSVTYRIDGEEVLITGELFLDGTDIGDLIALSGTAYRVGAESKAETGEAHAPEVANPRDMQPATYSAAIENRLTGDYTIPKPALYDEFRALMMPYDIYPVFSMYGPDSSTGKAKRFGMFPGETDENGNELFPLFKYRKIVESSYFVDGSEPYDVTLINWPQNDFFLGNLFDCPDAEENDYRARQFTLSFVYWLQTECPRADGGKGYPFFRLAGEYLGTEDGLCKAAYIRESRRIRGKFTVTGEMLRKGGNPVFPDSVGVGSYHIDLHITTDTHTFFYEPSERFTIPLGAMIPEKMTNLIPACKNISATHLSGGCYRLHPVEWNVGEVAGMLAVFALTHGVQTVDVWQDKTLFDEFVKLIEANGIQRYWKD